MSAELRRHVELNSTEVGKLLGVTRVSIENWTKAGWIPHTLTAEGRYRYARDYVETMARWAGGKKPSQEMVQLYRRLYELLGPPQGQFGLVTESEIAYETNTVRSTLLRWIRHEDPPFVTLFGRRFYSVAAMKDWKQRRDAAQEPKPPPPEPLTIEELFNMGRSLITDAVTVPEREAWAILELEPTELRLCREAKTLLFTGKPLEAYYPQDYLDDLKAYLDMYRKYTPVQELCWLHLLQYLYTNVPDESTRERLRYQCRNWVKSGMLLGCAQAYQTLEIKPRALNGWERRNKFPSTKVGEYRYFAPLITAKMAEISRLSNSIEAAAYLRIATKQLHKLADRGQIPCLHDAGGTRRYTAAVLEQYAARNRSSSA